ncbi:HNH endonuclease [Priestia megaterium]|uniref:HNH endonuclease n=1 Tax=Priestia megaterium TaxID=1404 RepID=UPI0011A1A00C|nr:HNH endonuclease [Priestia megaterium]
MAIPITVIKNDNLLFEEIDIQEAAMILAETLNVTKFRCNDLVERGYVYNIPYYVEEDEYRFVASKEVADNRRKELEQNNHKNARRIWLVPANPNEYDLESAFSRYEILDWKRSYNYENGDILFMYVSGNIQKVRYKVEVIEGLLGTNNVKYDNAFWMDDRKFEQSKEWKYMRFRLVDEIDTTELSLKKLRERGLKGNIQGAMKLTGELRDYIMSFFKQDLTEGYYPDEVSQTLEEGKRKTVTVNVYERNPIARKRCIDYYGVQCQVCDVDFENKYGEVGKDFIHVHHIKPLHEIQQEYIVDPIQDLIPVCPNCHAMLHRQENGRYLSTEQLKERILTVTK